MRTTTQPAQPVLNRLKPLFSPHRKFPNDLTSYQSPPDARTMERSLKPLPDGHTPDRSTSKPWHGLIGRLGRRLIDKPNHGQCLARKIGPAIIQDNIRIGLWRQGALPTTWGGGGGGGGGGRTSHTTRAGPFSGVRVGFYEASDRDWHEQNPLPGFWHHCRSGVLGSFPWR